MLNFGRTKILIIYLSLVISELEILSTFSVESKFEEGMKGFLKGFNGYFLAHQFVKEHKLWKFVLIPGIINLVLIILLMMWAIRVSDFFVTTVFDFFNILTVLPSWLGWLEWLVSFILGLMVKSIVIGAYLFIYKNLILIIVSPFMSYLAEKVHEYRTGEIKPFNLEQFVKDTVRGIRIAMRNIVIEMMFIIGFIMLGFIPIIGLLSPFCLLLIQFYFYGFSMLDYTMEAKSIDYKTSIDLIKRKKSLAIGNGFGFYLLMLLPFIGWMFAPTYGVIAAYLTNEDH